VQPVLGLLEEHMRQRIELYLGDVRRMDGPIGAMATTGAGW